MSGKDAQISNVSYPEMPKRKNPFMRDGQCEDSD